jgi:RNA polymerase sigma-70 factor (ECF subfamily)
MTNNKLHLYRNSTDNNLVNLYQQGDELAFEQLMKRHKTKVYNAVFQIVRERSADSQFLAKDLTQDTFIRVVDSIRAGKYKEENRFLPWVLRIARNLAIDYYRRSKRVPTTSFENMVNTLEVNEEFQQSADIVFDSQARKETSAVLRACIAQLPDTQREVLMLRHFAELSFKEIAEITDVSINTALGRMRYALINLRKLMQQSNSEYAREFEFNAH